MARERGHRPPIRDGAWARSRAWRRVAAIGLTLPVIVGAMAGCGRTSYLNEADRLRRENMELKDKNQQLTERTERLEGRLKTLRQRLSGPSATRPAVDEPALSQIKLGRYTGPIDNDGDGIDDTMRLYVRTLDQHGRMLPVAAEATVKVVRIPSRGEPKALATKTYDASAFNEAYRSSFTGQHYTLQVSLPRPLPEGVDEVTAKVIVEHAETGTRFSSQGTYRLTRE